MRAFNPLFRRRVPVYRRGSSFTSLIGLAGIGYIAYRWLQSPKGQEIQTQVMDGVKNVTKKWNDQAQQANV
jgi:hypothetical protein